MSEVDVLANEIRRVDGMHAMGAGALAEALMPFIDREFVPRAGVAKLIEALEVAQGDLHMLKKAVKARDPWHELLVRVTDTEFDLRAALANIGSTK